MPHFPFLSIDQIALARLPWAGGSFPREVMDYPEVDANERVRHLERQCRILAEELKDVDGQRRMAINQSNKMQLLSRSQTAILRANFTSKIKQRDVIINDLFDAIRDLEEKSSKEEGPESSSPLESLTDRWRKICRNNAGLGENEADLLVKEMEELRAENKRLTELVKNASAIVAPAADQQSGSHTTYPSAGTEALLEEERIKVTKLSETLRKEQSDKQVTLNQMEAKYQKEIKDLMRSSKRANVTQSALCRVLKTSSQVKSDLTSLKGAIQHQMKVVLTETSRETGQSVTRFVLEQTQQYNQLKQQYRTEVVERKRLFNLVQELRGNIRVLCRCRPPTEKEQTLETGSAICVTFIPENDEVSLVYGRKDKTWGFDKVFGFGTSQEEVYNEVSPLVTSVLDGYNVCIFAYGQTGTGKTYTMTGPPNDRGVNIRALAELFERSEVRQGEILDEISVSILEIYNEQIQDLLSDEIGGKKLEVRQGPQGMFVTDLTVVKVESMAQVAKLMKLGDQHRSSATTNMNEHSSRSHLLLSVYITSRNLTSNVVSYGKLHLIDLAGSERVGKSQVVGQALKEAQNINKSLSALGDVIAALVNKQQHVPYRNSTLTYLLQDSLGGDSKTLMLCCISPVQYNAEETYCSLNFASRVRTVELGKATKHASPAGGDARLTMTGGMMMTAMTGTSLFDRTSPLQQNEGGGLGSTGRQSLRPSPSKPR